MRHQHDRTGPAPRNPLRLVNPVVCRVVIVAVPTAWIVTWGTRGLTTPAGGGREDFPYPAVLAIGVGGPLLVALGAYRAVESRRGWLTLVGLTGGASLVAWLSGRLLMELPPVGDLVCVSGSGTGPHLAFRRLTTLVLLRPEGGYAPHKYGNAIIAGNVVGVLSYLTASVWAFRMQTGHAIVWLAAIPAAMALWAVVMILGEGMPATCID